jgi:hypothetical protein
VTDNETAEVMWEHHGSNEFVLLCITVSGCKESGVISVFPAVMWVDNKPKVVE